MPLRKGQNNRPASKTHKGPVKFKVHKKAVAARRAAIKAR